MDLDAMVLAARDRVLASAWLDGRRRAAYERIVAALHERLADLAWPAEQAIRVQGDCHIGNMLGRDEHFALVDFDDCLMAPAVQDIWMLITAQRDEERHMQLSERSEERRVGKEGRNA